MKDSTTSLPNLPIYAATSVPLGSGLASVAYAERNGVHYLSLPTQEPGTRSNGRRWPLPRIEERARLTPSPRRRGSASQNVSEEDRGISDQPTASDTVCCWTEEKEAQTAQCEVHCCYLSDSAATTTRKK